MEASGYIQHEKSDSAQARGDGTVFATLDKAEALAAQIDEALKTLIARIDPVLTPTDVPDRDGVVDPAKPLTSGLATRIGHHNDVLGSILHRLHAVHGKVEL